MRYDNYSKKIGLNFINNNRISKNTTNRYFHTFGKLKEVENRNFIIDFGEVLNLSSIKFECWVIF